MFGRYIGFIVIGVAATQLIWATQTKKEAALLKRDKDWAAVSSKGKDADAIVAYWTDDATIYPSAGPVIHGKSAIRKYITASLSMKGFHISWKPEQATVSADGTLGYTVGTNAVTIPGPNGKPMTTRGRYLTTWKRVHGVWKCTVDFLSSDY